MLLHARHICTKACIAQLYACIHMHRQSNTFCFTGTKCSESKFLLTLETKWGVLLVTGLQGSEKEGERNRHRWSRRRSNTKKTNTIATFPHYLANISQIPSIFLFSRSFFSWIDLCLCRGSHVEFRVFC